MMLTARWLELMKRLGLSENRETYHQLIDAYSEKYRKYHNLSHLCSVLARLDEVKHLTEKKDEIELALWFHDAVYQPFSKSNESDSAEWARKFLDENDMTEQVQELVHRLVLATSHSSVLKSDDEKLIVDVDLSILGTSKDQYAQFETGVRSEYRQVPSSVYARGRKAVLKGFLQRDRIYSSEPFYEAFERQARNNLESELCRLQRGEKPT
jgi:predicted metal-dependent HD superfamily phosphohydrolase